MSDKIRIRQSFALAARSYDSVARLQREVGGELLRYAEPAAPGAVLLDLGCGTGFVTDQWLQRYPGRTIVALDLAFPMLQAAKVKLEGDAPVHYLCADAERLPLATASLDGVTSNLALQWLKRLDKTFADIHRVLKPDGALAFSTFTDGTLQELKDAWAAADDYRHVNEFYDRQTIQQLAQAAGFRNIRCHSRLYQPQYAGVSHLLKELKQLGARTVVTGRQPRLTGKRRMQAMMDAYPKQGDGRIQVSFHVLTITAKR